MNNSNATNATANILKGNVQSDNQTKPVKPTYSYSREYGRTVLTDVNSNI
jgi:hypothetical protein